MFLVQKITLVFRKWSFLTLSIVKHEIVRSEVSEPHSNSFSVFPCRGTCVHWGVLCIGACSGSHVAGDGEDHHQAHVRLPEKLHFWWRLWVCTGGVRVGPPRPQSWAGTSAERASRRFSTRSRFTFHRQSASLANSHSALTQSDCIKLHRSE